jgi:hypothetical protein
VIGEVLELGQVAAQTGEFFMPEALGEGRSVIRLLWAESLGSSYRQCLAGGIQCGLGTPSSDRYFAFA